MSGIFIKSIIAGSSADKCGLLRVGDRILGKIFEHTETFSIIFKIPISSSKLLHAKKKSAVDGTDIRHSSHEMAVKTIKNAGDRMTLRVQSLNTGVCNQIRSP